MYQNIMLKGLLLFNKCATYFSSAKQYIYHAYLHMKQSLMNYDYSLWIFLPGHSLPLPLSALSNPPISYWKYDIYTNQLIYHSDKATKKHTLSVLSAKLIVISSMGVKQEYDMDPFLETFSIYTDTQPPTLQMIYMSWCAQHKLWFPADCHITIEYIDHLGNFISANLADHPMIRIQENKLYIM